MRSMTRLVVKICVEGREPEASLVKMKAKEITAVAAPAEMAIGLVPTSRGVNRC